MFVLFTSLKLTLDERKTLTKISMRNRSQQFPQTSTCFGQVKQAKLQGNQKNHCAQFTRRKPVKSILQDNTVANFLSQMNERLPEEEVQEYLNQIPYPGVKAVLNNAITPIEERAEQGVRLTPDCQGDSQEVTVEARPARLATTNVTDWKQEQKEDPVLYQVAKHLRAPCETFKAALHKVLDKKATATYVKVKEQLLIKNGLLYWKTWQGQANEIVFQFVVPQRHRGTTLDGCH